MVIGHPLIWINLLRYRVRIYEGCKYIFYITLYVFCFAVYMSGFSVGYYTTTLLILYALMTGVSTWIYNREHHFLEAVSLAFLTVQLNSLYWEMPLHISEMLSVGFHVGMLVQATRLLPLLWFIPNLKLGVKGKRWLLAGFGLSGVLMTLRLWVLPHVWGKWVHVLNRVLCLAVLVYVVATSKRQH